MTTGLAEGDTLSNLVTALSEKEMPKPKSPRKLIVKAQKLDYLQEQLKFVFDCGVTMRLKPSNENIYDGDFISVMGLVYAIMVKFLKFDDDDGESSGNAQDALLRWCQFSSRGFEGVSVTALTGKSWKDGLALAAIVAKFAGPEHLDFKALSASAGGANVQAAMDAAHKAFGIEPFLSADDFRKLAEKDEKSMLIVLSEYYYGINAFFKRKIAAKRIEKLVTFTRENDAARAKYAAEGAALLEQLAQADALLADVDTVDDTMAGAVRRVDDLKRYKKDLKLQIAAKHLDALGGFNALQLRLANNERPAYAPPAEMAPPALKARIEAVKVRAAAEPKLFAELNRQLKLVGQNAQHESQAAKLQEWVANKADFLAEPVVATSSGDAQRQLKQFSSYEKEQAAVQADALAALTALGAELAAERYEGGAAVAAREAALAEGFSGLTAKAAENRPVLEDNLQRETFRERVVMQADVHADIHRKLVAWGVDKAAHLKQREVVASVAEAQQQLSLLDASDREVADVQSGNFARLTELGGEIRGAKYQSALSSWVYEKSAELEAQESDISATMEALAAASAEKRAVNEDHLQREQLKERVELMAAEHGQLASALEAWGAEKAEYLAKKEEVANSQSARQHLARLEAYTKEAASHEAAEVAALKSLGGDVLETEYMSPHSEWRYGAPEAITAAHDAADALMARLREACAAKQAVLDDDLARELYAEKTRLLAGRHVEGGSKCATWAGEKAAFLQSDLVVHSIREAQVGTSLLEAYGSEMERFTAISVASLKALGEEVLARQYKTELSAYVYERPEEIREREAEVDEHWAQLATLSAARAKTLADLLARELRKEELRIEFADAAEGLKRFGVDVVARIGTQAEQKLLFGHTLAEVEAYGPKLAAGDEATAARLAEERARIDALVTEMAGLVRATEQFDRAQEEAATAALDDSLTVDDADADPKDAEAALAGLVSPQTVRRRRFNTLTKSIKKAFGKGKKKQTALLRLQEVGESSDADVGGAPWPEPANPYTEVTVDVLSHWRDEVATAAAERRTVYEAELARWREDDAMCKQYAELAVPPADSAAALSAALSESSGTDEAQLAEVQGATASIAAEEGKVPEIEAQHAAITARGVTINPYTVVTPEDVGQGLANVKAMATQKEAYLAALIEFKKLKGISQEQYDEMEALFKDHDRDSSNSIDAKELRSCLYSLGEERAKSEIAGYVDKYGSGGKLSFVQFRELMVTLIGDVGTKPGVNEAFRMFSGGWAFVTLEQLGELVAPDCVEFFAAEAAESEEGDGKNFEAWIDAVFAR